MKATRTIRELTDKEKQRFWNKVNKEGRPNPEIGNCWEWTAATALGYGRFGIGYGVFLATRVAWAIEFGDTRFHVLHKCDNPRCVRTGHLFLGTHTDNMRDMTRKKRNGFTVNPARAPRGDSHYSKTRPHLLARGVNHANAKLNDEKVREMRRIHAAGGITFSAIGKMFGVNKHTARLTIKRKMWTHVD